MAGAKASIIAGTKFKYAIPTSLGTAPIESTYKIFTDSIRSIPEINVKPSSIDTTTIDNDKNTTGIPALSDLSGGFDFTILLNASAKTDAKAILTYQDAGFLFGEVFFRLEFYGTFMTMYSWQGIMSDLIPNGGSAGDLAEGTISIFPSTTIIMADIPTLPLGTQNFDSKMSKL